MPDPQDPQGSWDVLVVIPPDPAHPTSTQTARYVGPYTLYQDADVAIAAFEAMRPGRVAEGTGFHVMRHDPTVEHLDPYPPLDVEQLAAAIEAQPPGQESVYGFPGLFARLVAAHGNDVAQPAWNNAVGRVWAGPTAASTPPGRLRAKVREQAARMPSYVTEPVIDAAARLLADLLDAGRRHGIEPGHWEISLAVAALEATIAALRSTRPDTGEKAVPLLAAFAERMTELGQPCDHDPRLIEVHLPRLPGTPTRVPLAVGLAYHTGWDLWARTGGTTPVVSIYAPFTVAGAKAVADVAAAINRGEHGYPFTH